MASTPEQLLNELMLDGKHVPNAYEVIVIARAVLQDTASDIRDGIMASLTESYDGAPIEGVEV